ncbi:MAG: IgGFc-binding protein, partial [Polyangiaceae bacterium]
MRVILRHVSFIGVVAFVIAACGSRTGLLGGDLTDFVVDASPDVVGDQTMLVDGQQPDEGFPDGPLFEGGPLDVITDCADPAYCDPRDLGNVYKCGVPVFQCSSLESCVNAKCVNPCQDTLGQDTSNGCEFFAPEMDTVPEAEGVCYAVFIVNQWKTGEPARIEVDRGGTSLPIEQFARIPVGTGTNIVYTPYVKAQGLARDQIAILFLSRDPAAAADTTFGNAAPKVLANCPAGVTPAFVGDAALHGTGTGTAFHIKTNVPVVSYQILPYGGGSARVTGATLLLPTNVWDNNYLAVNAYAKPSMAIGEDRVGPTLAILAQQDNTHVTIKPTAAIVAGGGLAGSAVNASTTYTVNRGQYLQFTQDAELTGSAIQSDQPIAVIGGSTLMDVPLALLRGDGAQQMLPPVKALGSEYLGVRYRSRNKVTPESVPWRIVGAVDG